MPQKVEHRVREGVTKKECGGCGEWKPLADYYADISHWDKCTSQCKACYAVYYAEHRELRRTRKEGYHLRWLQFINADTLACGVCGYHKMFEVLEFHHINSKEKKFNISYLFDLVCNEKNQKIMTEELKKCRVLCANCHRELHVLLK